MALPIAFTPARANLQTPIEELNMICARHREELLELLPPRVAGRGAAIDPVLPLLLSRDDEGESEGAGEEDWDDNDFDDDFDDDFEEQLDDELDADLLDEPTGGDKDDEIGDEDEEEFEEEDEF